MPPFVHSVPDTCRIIPAGSDVLFIFHDTGWFTVQTLGILLRPVILNPFAALDLRPLLQSWPLTFEIIKRNGVSTGGLHQRQFKFKDLAGTRVLRKEFDEIAPHVAAGVVY
jgi:hypothetical protein